MSKMWKSTLKELVLQIGIRHQSCQGDKIGFDKNEVICKQGESITHTIDEASSIQAQEVFGLQRKHQVVQLVCSAVKILSVDEWTIYLP